MFQGPTRPGIGSGRFSVRCVIHRCSSCGISWYEMARAAAGAGLRGGGSPARVFWAMPGPRAMGTGAKEGGVWVVAHRARNWTGKRRRGVVGEEVVRRRWGSSAVRVRGCSSELRIPSSRFAVVLRRWKEVRRTGAGPAARNFGEEQLTGGGLWVKIRRGRDLDRGERARESSLGARRCSCEGLPGWRGSGVA